MIPRNITVLVVDDSAFMRKALRRMLGSDPAIRVIADARDGLEAVEKVKQFQPDVVTLDVKMPGLDGIQTLERIMRERPTPVLMVSSLTSEGGQITLRALEMGAVDFIDKSSCHTQMDIIEIAESLVQKVKVIAGVDLKRVADSKPAPQPPAETPAPVGATVRDDNPTHLVAIGTSTGGPMSLEKVLTALPGDYPGAILVVQHMPVGFTASLAERMNQLCRLTIKEAREDEPLRPGTVYIAPGGYHLKIQRAVQKYRVVLSKEPRDVQHHPSVDEMMISAAENWTGPMLGIIMTGMGADGVRGIAAMKQAGAAILAQNEQTCVVYGMPRAAFLSGNVDRMVALEKIADEIIGFIRP
jgi:two-component system, chemotaxis family, protein-glutamate methylesterase/glutaminase